MQSWCRARGRIFNSVIVILFAAGFLAGCSAVRGYQEPLVIPKSLVDEPKCGNLNPYENKECRNQYIDYYVVKSSINFSTFVRQLTKGTNLSELSIDTLRTGVDAAVAVVGGAGTKSALGAAGVGLGGFQGAINKRLFYEKTVPALIKFMDAKRSLILAEILQGRKQEIDEYPFSLALRDLQRFNDAGSIPDAINAVAAEGAKQAEEGDKVLSRTIRAEGKPPTRDIIDETSYVLDFLSAKAPGGEYYVSDKRLIDYATAVGADASDPAREALIDAIVASFFAVNDEEGLKKIRAPFISGNLSDLKAEFEKFVEAARAQGKAGQDAAN